MIMFFLKVEYSLDLKFESILHSYNIIEENIQEIDIEDIQEEEAAEAWVYIPPDALNWGHSKNISIFSSILT